MMMNALLPVAVPAAVSENACRIPIVSIAARAGPAAGPTLIGPVALGRPVRVASENRPCCVSAERPACG